ncbi:hypothetical protein ACFX5E_09345 [Flavobacterium sp. LS2P90]|uniref:Uncharacterized protein n=1 Tax=Flavobacterium xylosi TaxID=3230415 RepID=A0ABW6HW92_9FLAO
MHRCILKTKNHVTLESENTLQNGIYATISIIPIAEPTEGFLLFQDGTILKKGEFHFGDSPYNISYKLNDLNN